MTFHPDIQLNYIAIIVAAVIYFIIGALWYSVFFRKAWIAETNVQQPEKSSAAALAIAGQFLSTLLYTFGLGIVFSALGANDVTSCIHIALVFSIFFIIPMNSGILFFQNKKKLFLIDVSERITGSIVIAIILGIWG